MTQDQFAKLFNYMEQRFNTVDERFEVMDRRFDDMTTLVDGYAAKVDSYTQEMTIGDYEMKRLEKYTQVIAKKIGVDLSKIKI